MDWPKIDPSMLPDLATLTGLYGSLTDAGRHYDDSIVILATVVYEAGLT